MKTEYAIGRTRTGDQLHLCRGHVTYDDGRVSFGDNAFCNNHIHLACSLPRNDRKMTIKLRPGLFCRKCFGDDAAHIVSRSFFNAVVTE